MIAENVIQEGSLRRSRKLVEMIEALVPTRAGRNFLRRQQAVELHRNKEGVPHLSIGVTRVCRQPPDRHMRGSRVEVLVLQLTDRGTVHRVRVIHAEVIHVDVPRPVSHLLVRCKHYADRPVRVLLMPQEKLRRLHDLRNPGLVVSAEHRCPVRHDNRLSDLVLKKRILRGAHGNTLLRVQDNLPAVILLDKPWVHEGMLLRIHRIGSIHMRHKAQNRRRILTVLFRRVRKRWNHRAIRGNRPRNRRVHIALRLIVIHVCGAHRLKLIPEHHRKIPLTLGRRRIRDTLLRLREHPRVPQEPRRHFPFVKMSHNQNSFRQIPRCRPSKEMIILLCTTS